MSPFQTAFDRVRQVETELASVQVSLGNTWRSTSGEIRHQAGVARFYSEKTYLLRLLSEFEGAITDLGPHLRKPVTFTKDHGLGDKLNAIGKNMGMNSRFRDQMDKDIRDLRNELAHGRSPVPRVAFDDATVLVRQFLRSCS